MSIILIKNNKGGVGKSWLTLQLAHGLQIATEKKVLIITSDNQNNILEYSGMEAVPVSSGLEGWIKKKEGDLIQIRKNLFFIPLKDSTLNSSYDKFKTTIDSFKNDFDYILIDSTPTLGIDKYFIDIADKIIIPGYADKVTFGAISRLMDEIPNIGKLKAIVINRWGNTALEKQYFESLKEITSSYGITLGFPIQQTAFITKMIDKGKTIWETKSKLKKIDNIQSTLIKVMEDLV